MRKDKQTVFRQLEDLLDRLVQQPLREHSDPWSDWENGTTGGQKHPCVYCLYSDESALSPLYVGETVNLGVRLSRHDDANKDLVDRWNYVKYLSDSSFKEPRLRKLFEAFSIYMLDPKKNSGYSDE